MRVRRFTYIICALIALSIFAAATCIDTASEPADAGQARAQAAVYERVLTDICANGDGRYSLLADIQLNLDEHGLESVSISEPTLLAFSVSSAHGGGVWILDMTAGEDLLGILEDMREGFERDGDAEAIDKVNLAIERLELSGPIAGAST